MVNMMNFETEEDKKSHLQSLKNIPSINPRVYNQDDEYNRLDFIKHSTMGVGFVEEIISDSEIKVFFASGVTTLPQKNYLNN